MALTTDMQVTDIYKEVYKNTNSFDFDLERLTVLSSLPYIEYDEFYPEIKDIKMTSIGKCSIEHLVDAKGIYALYDCNGECIYVGQSNNLAVRLYQHINGLTNTAGISDMIDDIKIVLCYDGFLREIYETVLINKLQPYENREKVFYNRKEV